MWLFTKIHIWALPTPKLFFKPTCSLLIFSPFSCLLLNSTQAVHQYTQQHTVGQFLWNFPLNRGKDHSMVTLAIMAAVEPIHFGPGTKERGGKRKEMLALCLLRPLQPGALVVNAVFIASRQIKKPSPHLTFQNSNYYFTILLLAPNPVSRQIQRIK